MDNGLDYTYDFCSEEHDELLEKGFRGLMRKLMSVIYL